MSRWFRHYAGMMRDDKLVRIALRSRQPVERVLWVWGAVLESAAELNADGRYEFDVAEASRFLGAEPKHLRAIVRALHDAGHIYCGVVTKWSNRQFKSDRSNERVAKHRQEKRQQSAKDDSGNVTAQLPKRYGNSPETETETETDHQTQGGVVRGDTRAHTREGRDGLRVIPGGGK